MDTDETAINALKELLAVRASGYSMSSSLFTEFFKVARNHSSAALW